MTKTGLTETGLRAGDDVVRAERRRIQGDLHDGLGPTLAGLALGLELAGTCLHTDPAQAELLIQRLRDDVDLAVEELRRLLEGLQPPALDHSCLVTAVRSRSAAITGATGGRPSVAVVVPRPIRRLPAPVAAAAYRIIDEALCNVVRHAGARSCRVRLECGDDLRIEIADDGRWSQRRRGGLGLASMRRRAADLNGTCRVRTGPEGSTITVLLPVARP